MRFYLYFRLILVDYLILFGVEIVSDEYYCCNYKWY